MSLAIAGIVITWIYSGDNYSPAAMEIAFWQIVIGSIWFFLVFAFQLGRHWR